MRVAFIAIAEGKLSSWYRRIRWAVAILPGLYTAVMTSQAIHHPDVALLWDAAALQSIRDAKAGAPIVSRTMAIVHTCMYDAWAAYDDRAVGTQLSGALRRPRREQTLPNKERAVSYAAYRALVDLLPSDADPIYDPLMSRLGYDPADTSTDIETPTGIGNVACAAVLEFRHRDGSNQLGDLAEGAYTDWTNFIPENPPSRVPVRGTVPNPDRWQPLNYVSPTGDLVTQQFLVPQWGQVTPFAIQKGSEFRTIVSLMAPAHYGTAEYTRQAGELVDLSANLTDRQKTIAEYWLDGPNSEQPPGHWLLFAQWISRRDGHTLDDDVKMLFVLSNALFDAGIAAWDTKRAFDSVRPVTAIPLVFKGQRIRAWGGPGKGTVEMEGSGWTPYQPTTFPTPPFPDFVSGHSTFSAAAAYILQAWTGSDRFGYTVTFARHSSKVEPELTPDQPIVMMWPNFSDAAAEAGMSRRYGGIHFERADLAGRLLGRLVGARTWSKAREYFDGTFNKNYDEQNTILCLSETVADPE